MISVNKIYEALGNAGRLPKALEEAEARLAQSSVESSYAHVGKLGMEEEMSVLYQSIRLLLPDVQKRAIQFIGSREGEGTSTIARQFASTVATTFNKSVLILDADARKPSQHVYFDIQPKLTWEDLLRDSQPVDGAIYKVRNANVCISLIYQQATVVPRVINATIIKELLEDLKSTFDLIVIDSAPAGDSSVGVALSGSVDGVVLVVEAENTRWQVAENVKEKIMRNSGNILGVVLNKQQHFIPEFIYRRL